MPLGHSSLSGCQPWAIEDPHRPSLGGAPFSALPSLQKSVDALFTRECVCSLRERAAFRLFSGILGVQHLNAVGKVLQVQESATLSLRPQASAPALVRPAVPPSSRTGTRERGIPGGRESGCGRSDGCRVCRSPAPRTRRPSRIRSW